MSRVTGLDLSLTATGIATYGEFGWDEVSTIKCKAPSSVLLGKARIQNRAEVHARLGKILDAVTSHAMGSDLVVVEGPSFGSTGSAAHQIAGLWWLVTNRLHRLGLDVVVATPSQVKKYLTGSGNADKDVMVIEATKRLPEAKAANNNEVDAVVLAALGRHLLDEPIVDLPKTHTEVVAKIEEARRAAA